MTKELEHQNALVLEEMSKTLERTGRGMGSPDDDADQSTRLKRLLDDSESLLGLFGSLLTSFRLPQKASAETQPVVRIEPKKRELRSSEAILVMYAQGMAVADIQGYLETPCIEINNIIDKFAPYM